MAARTSASHWLGLRLSPLGARRLANFRANRRGLISLWVFLVLFGVSLFAELIANDRPLLVRYDGQFYFPVLVAYPETTFGGFFETEAAYDDPEVQEPDPRARLDRLAADPLQLRHRRPRPARPGAVAADAPELAGHRRPGPRRAGPDHLRPAHLGPVRPAADAAQLGGRHRRRRRPGLFRRLGRSRASSASWRSGAGSRSSIS